MPFIEKEHWTDDQEEVLKNISHNAGCMSEHHKEKYNEYQRNLMFQKRTNPHFEFQKICKIFRNILF